MKTKFIIIVLFASFFFGCKKMLEEHVYSELSEENFLITEKGIDAVLNQAYSLSQQHSHNISFLIHSDLVVTGRGDGKKGAWEGDQIVYFRNWTWNSTQERLRLEWDIYYNTIYACNAVIDHIDNNQFSDDFIKRMKGEALALRGYSYYALYDYFGPVIINTSTESAGELKARATEEDTRNRIEEDLKEAIDLLPKVQKDRYRVDKGAAMGVLCKYYLNTKQWDKVVTVSENIQKLGQYELYSDYIKLFTIQGEDNKEYMWTFPAANKPDVQNTLLGLTYPSDYPFPGDFNPWPALIYIYDWVVDLYSDNDIRKGIFVTQYENKSGDIIIGYGKNQSLIFKYGIDPDGDAGNGAPNFPLVRFADVLLAKAEALNELKGPNVESLDLLNQIRRRSGLVNISDSDVNGKGELRDLIFREREKEFLFEAKTRQDFIREGIFVSDAQNRGVAGAEDFRKIYPIPQAELNSNSEAKQNPGY